MAEIQKEIWTDYIAENLYKNNDFLNMCFVADDRVNGKTVHMGSAGTAASVTRNRTVLPATVVQRTDDDNSYDIDEFTVDPTVIPNADTVELTYDKIDSVMYDTMKNLSQSVGSWMLYNWRATAAAYQVRTTGGSADTHISGTTGTRKKLLAADIQSAARTFNDLDIEDTDRYILLDAYMYNQLLSDLKFGEFRDSVKQMDLAKGIIGELYGFNILRRGTVLNYTNAPLPITREPGAAALATANGAAICWQKAAVERAFGDIKFFEAIGLPEYYGDTYSGLVRSGGIKRRYDGKGVVSIIQTLLT